MHNTAISTDPAFEDLAYWVDECQQLIRDESISFVHSLALISGCSEFQESSITTEELRKALYFSLRDLN